MDGSQFVKHTVQQANALLRENRCDEALTLLNTLPADAEQAGIINYVKGNTFAAMGQDEQAHLCYAEALKQGFVHKRLYINFGMVKARMRRIRDAEAMFRQAADLDVSDPLPLNQIVFLYLGLGDFAKAGRAMDELTERFPELIDGYHHKADLLLGTGETKAALKLLLEVEERFSSNALYIYDICRALGRLGQSEKALEYLEGSEKVFEDADSGTLYWKQKAMLLTDLERYDEAAPIWQALYETNGDRQSAMALIAKAIGETDWQTAYDLAEEIIAYEWDDEFHYFCLYHRAVCLKMLGREAEAEQALRTACARYDEMADDRIGIKFRTLRATVRMELGRYEEALADLDFMEEWSKKNGDSPETVTRFHEQVQPLRQRIEEKMTSFH